MCFAFISAQFSCLIGFVLLHKENLIEGPCKGNLNFIKCVYLLYCKENNGEKIEDLQQFTAFLLEFNGISNDALVFGESTYTKEKTLLWINLANIKMLKDRLASLEEPGKPLQVAVVKRGYEELLSPEAKLEIILGLLLHTALAPVSEEIDGSDFDKLSKILAQPTACVLLGIARAKVISPKKQFHEACEIANHNQVLANLCLNSKTIGQSVQDLPSNAKFHKVINSCKGLISKEILNCIKSKVHFLPLVTGSTDLFLGNCSYLDTCHKLKNCRYLHYYTLNTPPCEEDKRIEEVGTLEYTIGECGREKEDLPPQWINCDVRYLPFKILGKFAAIVSDPAWDIHMSLPYGTCKDTEFLSLPMNELQEEGVLFLWVTGRSIEVGRKALAQWGYTVSDEMIWIKLNQLRRTIVTGRTGHWLNHSKEHLLVGIKGNPVWLNRKIDLDLMVSGTRETLRKPDELYGIVERLVGKKARKLEIFGRDHNIRPGWFSTCHLESHIHIKHTNTKQLEIN